MLYGEAMTANRDAVRANRSAIRAIREGKRIGLRRLSRQTGLNRGFLSQIELGRRGASARTLSRIAEALEVPVDAITIKGDS